MIDSNAEYESWKPTLNNHIGLIMSNTKADRNMLLYIDDGRSNTFDRANTENINTALHTDGESPVMNA